MKSVNLNQKVPPKTLEKYNERMDLYLKTGRITKRGEIFELLYIDHMESERNRFFLENCSDISKELFITLERIQSLLIQETEYSMLQKERIHIDYNDRLAMKDMKIQNLEDSMQKYKKDLEEKIVENADMQKGIEKLRRLNVKRTGS